MTNLEELLLPGEKIALTVANAQASRGELPESNIATVCTLALLRILGKYDYSQEEEDG